MNVMILYEHGSLPRRGVKKRRNILFILFCIFFPIYELFLYFVDLGNLCLWNHSIEIFFIGYVYTWCKTPIRK